MSNCIREELRAMMDGRDVVLLGASVDDWGLYLQVIKMINVDDPYGVYVEMYEQKGEEVNEVGVWYIGRRGLFRQQDMMRLFEVFDVAKGLVRRLGWEVISELLM